MSEDNDLLEEKIEALEESLKSSSDKTSFPSILKSTTRFFKKETVLSFCLFSVILFIVIIIFFLIMKPQVIIIYDKTKGSRVSYKRLFKHSFIYTLIILIILLIYFIYGNNITEICK